MAVTMSGFKEFCLISNAKASALGHLNIPSDEVLRIYLDSAGDIVKSMLGLKRTDSLPSVSTRVDHAVYLLANFYRQHNSALEKVSEMEIQDLIGERETRNFNKEIQPALFKMITGLLARDRNNLAFMPEVSTA